MIKSSYLYVKEITDVELKTKHKMKMKEFEALSFEYKGKTFEKCIDHEWIADACDNIISIIKKRRSYTKILYVSLLDSSAPFEEELSSKATWKMDNAYIKHELRGGKQSSKPPLSSFDIHSSKCSNTAVLCNLLFSRANTYQVCL